MAVTDTTMRKWRKEALTTKIEMIDFRAEVSAFMKTTLVWAKRVDVELANLSELLGSEPKEERTEKEVTAVRDHLEDLQRVLFDFDWVDIQRGSPIKLVEGKE